jgi:uncharacterized protein YdeI (YjbR/CyaY-like superfamily)
VAVPDDLELIEPRDRAEWRAWLERNHSTAERIWLSIGKKGNRVTSLTYNDAVEEALCFGWIDSTVRRLDNDRFRQLYSRRKARSIWARSNKERVARLIAAGLMRPAGLAAIEAAKANGSWSALDRIEDLTVPDDLASALSENPVALQNFDTFPSSARKAVLYWIQSAKRLETRTRRIAEVVQRSAEGRRFTD